MRMGPAGRGARKPLRNGKRVQYGGRIMRLETRRGGLWPGRLGVAAVAVALTACASSNYRPKDSSRAFLVQRAGSVEVMLPGGRIPADQKEPPNLACSETAGAHQENRRRQSGQAKLFNILGGALFFSGVPPMIFWPLAAGESSKAEGSAADVVNAFNAECRGPSS